MTFYRNLGTAFEDFLERRLEWIMLWPLFAYAVVLWSEPSMFDDFRHYQYLRDVMSPPGWEVVFLVIATLRVGSLLAKMLWSWPYYAPVALISSISAATLWSQFTLSFLVSYFVNGTTPGPVAAHSTLVLIEFLNIGHSARGVGQLVKRESS